MEWTERNRFGLQCHEALKAYTLQGVGRHVRAQLVHRSQVWPLAGGWLEDHEVEGAPRVVKDITTTLSEQSENISVLQRTVVADAHGGIFSKRFSGGGSFVISRRFRGSFCGDSPVGCERTENTEHIAAVRCEGGERQHRAVVRLLIRARDLLAAPEYILGLTPFLINCIAIPTNSLRTAR